MAAERDRIEADQRLSASAHQSLLDGLKERAAQLVASLTPNPLPLTTLTQVLKGLLAENIPLKEFRRIAQAIAVAATRSADAEEIIDGAYSLRSQILHTGSPADLDVDLERETRAVSAVIREIYASLLCSTRQLGKKRALPNGRMRKQRAHL